MPDDRNGSQEDRKERVDRELIELLNEVRVALPGVQVLFAFLLTLPFTQRFVDLSDRQEWVFVTALLLSALSAALLIAPTAHHRLSFRRGTKESMLRWANWLVLAGVGALALAVGCAVYISVCMAEAKEHAALIAGLVTGVTVLLWFLPPFVLFEEDDETPAPGSDHR